MHIVDHRDIVSFCSICVLPHLLCWHTTKLVLTMKRAINDTNADTVDKRGAHIGPSRNLSSAWSMLASGDDDSVICFDLESLEDLEMDFDTDTEAKTDDVQQRAPQRRRLGSCHKLAVIHPQTSVGSNGASSDLLCSSPHKLSKQLPFQIFEVATPSNDKVYQQTHYMNSSHVHVQALAALKPSRVSLSPSDKVRIPLQDITRNIEHSFNQKSSINTSPNTPIIAGNTEDDGDANKENIPPGSASSLDRLCSQNADWSRPKRPTLHRRASLENLPVPFHIYKSDTVE
jgi:hypothetical protein